ncbi:MAG: hypothetical protein KKD11_05790 [Candidatus Omnitrophica bacterium]|nr:hypothetical protein [Candidatus Omnitrophota bacterium]
MKTRILALGAQSKGSFCLIKNGKLHVSNSFGDLSEAENFHRFEKEVKKIKPKIVACDLHPDYSSTKLAKKLIAHSSLLIKEIQHHEAHVASCIADNNIKGKVIGVAFDGTGFGRDGNIWGGEFFIGTIKGFKRASHLKYAPMPGSEAAVREPWRMAFSYLYTLRNLGGCQRQPPRLRRVELKLLTQMIDKGINSPLTSSMGRLFDAVASLVGICDVSEYEGQAAVELERAIKRQATSDKGQGRYNFTYKDNIIDWTPVIKGIVKDLKAKKSKGEISLKFHNAACHMIKDVCVTLRKKYKINKVCMSGGVFQNKYLTKNAPMLLKKEGFKIYLHKRLPAHDGNIALGQLILAGA